VKVDTGGGWIATAILSVGLVGAVVLAALLFSGPAVRTIQCDGALPTWMISAQGYDGGGCAEILPDDQAPPNADWTPYCLGYCLDE
jgi:hypothetical protein